MVTPHGRSIPATTLRDRAQDFAGVRTTATRGCRVKGWAGDRPDNDDLGAPYSGEPIRLLLTCSREGYKLWAVLHEVHAALERMVPIRVTG